jgi:CRISPR system Cascade subunit CasB
VAGSATAKLFTDLFGEHYKNSGNHPEFAVRHLARAAVIAGVLAHVSDHQKHGTLARAIGPTEPKDPSSARLKPLRFKRLLAARSPDEVLTQFRRAVAMLDHTANVRDLALQLLAWTDEERGDIARTRFAFDYYDAEKFAPLATANNAAIDTDKD